MTNLLKNFALQKIIGCTTPDVLQHYFHSKDMLTDIVDFIKCKKEHGSHGYKLEIADRICNLEKAAGTVINDFQMVHVLTKKDAFLNLMNYIHYQKRFAYLLEDIRQQGIEKQHDKVFYFLQKEYALIESFYLIYSLKEQAVSYWNRRHHDIMTREHDITAEEIASLERAVKEELQKDSRGKHCKIQHILFDGKDHLLVMAEDMAITQLQWTHGITEEILVKPSFDIAFVYDRLEGELDTCCLTGGSKFRNKMQLAFSKAVLGTEIPELTEDEDIYDLSSIIKQLTQQQKVEFCTGVAPSVEDIFIRSMRLSGSNSRNDMITLDTRLKERLSNAHDDIFTALDDYLKLYKTSANKVDINSLTLTWMECVVTYYDPIRDKKIKKKFTISGRAGCNLGFDGIDKEIRACLLAARIQLPKVADAKQEAA